MNKVCKLCRESFQTSDKRRKFCGVECYRQYQKQHGNKGNFKTGSTPWNAGTVGVMKPNSGSFKKGRESEKRKELGEVTIRQDKADKPRAWIKVADNGNSYDWVLRAVHVWKSANGPLPFGHVVHHKDRNTLNDDISNLQSMTRSEHIKEHRNELKCK